MGAGLCGWQQPGPGAWGSLQCSSRRSPLPAAPLLCWGRWQRTAGTTFPLCMLRHTEPPQLCVLSTTDQLRLKICSIRSRPSMQLLSNDSGKMSIYLPSTNTGALSLKEQGKVRGILISCSLVQETTPHTIASLRENLSQWRWGKHSR